MIQDVTTYSTPFLCLWCRRYNDPDEDEDGDLVCGAYPDGIPADIQNNRADHRRPQPGDSGLRFLPDRDWARTGRELVEPLLPPVVVDATDGPP